MQSFYSSHISGCQRLPNGNTSIMSGNQGLMFEVTPTGEVVWQYTDPGSCRPATRSRSRPTAKTPSRTMTTRTE